MISALAAASSFFEIQYLFCLLVNESTQFPDGRKRVFQGGYFPFHVNSIDCSIGFFKSISSLFSKNYQYYYDCVSFEYRL